MSDLRRDFEGDGKDWTAPPVACPGCRGSRVVLVLGAGGDFENWPCPDCRPAEYRAAVADARSPGCGSGD